MADQSAADAQAFIAGLPEAGFTPEELALRAALVDFARARAPRPFPLTEWIEWRVGGELELRRTAAGQCELLLRGDAAPDTEAFFAGLDPAALGAEEEALRDALLECFARRSSKEPAALAELAGDAAVQRRAAALLPAGVQLREWIERRAGDALELRAGSGSPDAVHLTDESRALVSAKRERRAAKGPSSPAPGGKGHGQRQQRAAQPAPPAQAARQAKPPSCDAFFASLPEHELTQSELDLREALLGFIEAWPPLGKPATPCPLLSDLAQDPKLRRYRSFIPQTIQLKDWIDRRVGGEVEVRRDARGFEVRLRQAAAVSARGGPSPKSRTVDRAAGDQEAAGARRTNSAESAEDFIAKLPADSHTEAEADLRQAILGRLEGREAPVQLLEMSRDAAIERCRLALLPPEVPLRAWIDRRIGGEVETLKDETNQCVLRLRGADKEQFFDALPSDGFTADEEQLREALLDLLDGWKARDLPSLSRAGEDARVRKLRAKVLRNAVPLQEWIERRIGGEIELFEGPSGQLHFGRRGQGGQVPRKRGAAGGEHGPPRKRGGKGGAPPDRSGSWN